nr:NADH dehydrogenase subunit 7, mitochondrial [Tanacetum cinerariifolium]
MSGYPVISEKEFRSQQQVVLSGFYELSPFKIQSVNDADVTYFLKRRECDLFAIAYNRDVSKPSKKYMISSIAIEDELVLRGLALKQRLVDIGTVTAQQAKDWGFSGVMLRGLAT